jgi:hypothetical protein
MRTRPRQDIGATCFILLQNFIDLATTVSSKRRAIAKMCRYAGTWTGERNQETVNAAS